MSLLSVKNLTIRDKRTNNILVQDLSFELSLGKVLGIIGESGSGKSLTCKAILGLNPDWLEASGSVLFETEELLGKSHKDLRKIRGKKIAMVLQDAMNAFNPLYRVGHQMVESLCEFMSTAQAKKLSLQWLVKMGFEKPEVVFKSYAHELSGGMLQRVMIALALAQETQIIIADEPTSALDVIHQHEIINLFASIRDEKHSLIFVSHDLGIVSYLADDVLVMKEGKGIEYKPSQNLFSNPEHEYTNYLIQTRRTISQRFSQCLA
ncbi:ABC transporter ATP-binding protein [Sulfurospirillum arcachonense]|uniref:ABC transporter ATP-binding protein n=1 Tax=Sulfurospirillum arcachonense TaxID=57666 RepID=UPI000468724B|nr:ABC transporter ATP-binding protein [Sulfurospirillum arcachonense]